MGPDGAREGRSEGEIERRGKGGEGGWDVRKGPGGEREGGRG